MKKNINYFNYEERNGIFLLIFILLLFCLFIFLQKRVLPTESNITLVHASMSGETNSQRVNLISEFSKERDNRNSDSENNKEKKHWQKEGTLKQNRVSKEKGGSKLFFNKGGVSDTIKHDRSQKEKEGIAVKLQDKKKTNNYAQKSYKKEQKSWTKKPYKREPVKSFSMNSKDPLDWEQIYGIGPGYSKRIVKYQNWLGGFHSKDQIKEVYGITDSFYNTFKDHLKPSVPYRKLAINKVEEKQIGKHPYVSWKEAKNIIRYRNHHFPIQEKDFEKIRGISDSTRIKILPYLDFSVPIKEEEIQVEQDSVVIQTEK